MYTIMRLLFDTQPYVYRIKIIHQYIYIYYAPSDSVIVYKSEMMINKKISSFNEMIMRIHNANPLFNRDRGFVDANYSRHYMT